jgi:hypothetical protein
MKLIFPKRKSNILVFTFFRIIDIFSRNSSKLLGTSSKSQVAETPGPDLFTRPVQACLAWKKDLDSRAVKVSSSLTRAGLRLSG